MEKCKRMKGAIVYVKELDLFLTMKVFDKTPAVLSFGKLCDENGYSYGWINCQKPHFIKDGIRTICNTENFVFIVVPGLSSLSSGCSSILQTSMKQESHSPLFFFVFFIYSKWNSDSRTIGSNWEWHLSSNCVKYGQTDPILTKPWKSPTIKKGTQEGTGRPVVCHSGRASSEVPEWLQEFRENLVDDEIPEHGDSHASSSHEASSAPIVKIREDLCTQSVYTHFL